MIKKKKSHIEQKTQDKTSIDSKILTKLEELKWESERNKRTKGKEYGVSMLHLAQELGIHHNTLRDKLDSFTILQHLGINIRIVEDNSKRTIVMVDKDKNTGLKEINDKLDRLLEHVE